VDTGRPASQRCETIKGPMFADAVPVYTFEGDRRTSSETATTVVLWYFMARLWG